MPNRILLKVVAAAAMGVAFCTSKASLAEDKSASSGGVMPLRLPEQTSPELKGVQDRIYRLAQLQARWLLSAVHPWSENPEMKLLTESKSTEHWIRPNTATVAGFAFLYRFGPYDEKLVGVGRKELLQETILPMIRYLVATHVTGKQPTDDGRKWGNHWQSALWAQMLGHAAWWIWDDLPPSLRRDVRRVVAHEADRFVDAVPPHNLKNDTKAEENAWNSTILNMAVVVMPDDARRAAWEKAFQRWAMSSFLRPADEHSQQIVDGRPVSEQFSGANVHDDFTLENHRIVHPNYMGTFSTTLGMAVDYALSGRKPPEALAFNVRGLYTNLKWFLLPDGSYVFPNGQDWAVFQDPALLKLHIPMAVYAHDRDAWSIGKVCLEVTEKMQARDAKGAIYVPEEIVYRGSQEAAFGELGLCWLMLATAHEIVDRPQPLLGVRRLNHGKIIIHRTPKAVHSFSWGRVVMAQCVPLRMDRMVSPDQRNGIGRIQLEGDKKPLPIKLVSADVKDTADGFSADLTVEHGDAVRADLHFRSNADGTFAMRERLTALRDVTTRRIATGLIGILNNPTWVYETHKRTVKFDQQTANVPTLSGNVVPGKGVRRINVDGALRMVSAAPLSAQYVGAKKIERGRATDKLYLNYLDGEHDWKSGQAISTYEATLSPQGD